MIKKFYVTGDTHGRMDRFDALEMPNLEETGVIILGDAGVNFYKSKARRHEMKMQLEKHQCYFYLVRGNHEDRPENLKDIETIYDENVDGYVYIESEYPHIRYLKDGGVYDFNGYKTLVIGGAYSVDKWYRLENHYTWYSEEQLTKEEMADIEAEHKGDSFDFVLTHTCPYDWRPTDLFLPMVSQNTVDNTMELWMNDFKDMITWDMWLFGHYHADRLERPHVEMFYTGIESLESIWQRWHDPEALNPNTYHRKSPKYYME